MLAQTEAVHSTDFVAVASRLGKQFAECAATADEEDSFVAENYASLRSSGLVEAGVPKELGGGGASVGELAEMLRTLAHHCAKGICFGRSRRRHPDGGRGARNRGRCTDGAAFRHSDDIAECAH